MADKFETGIVRIEAGNSSPESVRLESEPWASFYKAGETVRELRRSLHTETIAGPCAPEQSERQRLDEDGASRMDAEGCPNSRGETRADAEWSSAIRERPPRAVSMVF